MQLPASVIQTPYSPSSSPRTSTQNSSTQSTTAQFPPDRPEPSSQGRPDQVEATSRSSTGPIEAELPANARVDQPEATELPAQELAIRERTETFSSNPAVSQYQQVAQQGADNASSQDPSLFRVDVYV